MNCSCFIIVNVLLISFEESKIEAIEINEVSLSSKGVLASHPNFNLLPSFANLSNSV